MTTTALATRGTSNTNARGNTEDRRRRREWLVQTYRANQDLLRYDWQDGGVGYWPITPDWLHLAEGETQRSRLVGILALVTRMPACRCYRCGILLTVDTVTVDRITPGCKGGTYRRNNIRPACGDCNSETGGALSGQGKRR